MINLYSMELQENSSDKPANPFPFNNLFLIKGYVTGKNEFWHYLLGIVAAILGYSLFQFITFKPLIAFAGRNGVVITQENIGIIYNPDAIGMNRSLMLAIMGGIFVFTMLFLWLALKFVQSKTFTSIITGFEKIRWKRYFFAFALWGILNVIYITISYFRAPQDFVVQFNTVDFSILLITVVLFLPIQTATEELIFRGYLMQGFALLFKNGIAPLIITSILFGLMHASNPEVKAHGLLIMMPYFISFALFLGILTLLDEGLEIAMGIHCANNLFSCLLICSKNSVLQTDAILQTNVENPAGEFLQWFIMAVICFFILFKKYKLSNWKLLIR